MMIFFDADEENTRRNTRNFAIKDVLERLMIFGITAVTVGVNTSSPDMSSNLTSLQTTGALNERVRKAAYPRKVDGGGCQKKLRPHAQL